ncbi:hypothetical protein ACSBR2_026056 [Camellia fascicularis]
MGVPRKAMRISLPLSLLTSADTLFFISISSLTRTVTRARFSLLLGHRIHQR